MKIISAILAVVVLFLAVQPVLGNFIVTAKEQPAHDCCTGMCKRSSPAQEKSNYPCKNGHCDNPFLVCSNSYFLNSNEPIFSLIPLFTSSKKTGLSNDSVVSFYIQDFWHPPETV
ncbi:hypothetical protein NIASO_01665 [Niabella soli DSM 19437]|uniref:Uncharacterized protein n=1 Tax=Niabella soli DSM 19437 TaxID=929713 RepID=W0F216_9BACT|nr:hypothetical protein NIASO_01665 [Niabella soli DSM 19437]